MGDDSSEYQPLATSVDDSSEYVNTRLASFRASRRWNWILSTVCALQAILNIGQLNVALSHEVASARAECLEPRLLYSPANDVVEPEIKVFTVGHSWTGFTKWQGNSPETDAAWQDLYNNTILRIPKEQAALLPNRTSRIDGDPDGYYIAQIDVFHQLHCLNMIRMKLGGDYYSDLAWELDEEHVNHCVDSIRQSLMCSSDTSVNVWQWSDVSNGLVGRSTQAHQCRSFEKIRDWARDHRMLEDTLHPIVKPPDDDLAWPADIYPDGSKGET